MSRGTPLWQTGRPPMTSLIAETGDAFSLTSAASRRFCLLPTRSLSSIATHKRTGQARCVGHLRVSSSLAAVRPLAFAEESYAVDPLDVLALRHVGRTLPSARRAGLLHRIRLQPRVRLPISSARRYVTPVYTPMGLSPGEVAETSAFVIITFVTGVIAVFPLVVLLDPSSLNVLGISRFASVAISIFGLGLIAGYVCRT